MQQKNSPKSNSDLGEFFYAFKALVSQYQLVDFKSIVKLKSITLKINMVATI